MNIEKYLVIINGEDKTEEVLSYELDKNVINVNFKNGKKAYTILRSNFKFYKDPVEIDIINNILTIDDSYVYNVEKVIRFKEYYRIFFKGNTTFIIPSYRVKIVNKEKRKKASNK